MSLDEANHNLRDYSAQALPDARKTAMQQSLILARMTIKLNHTIVHSKDPRAAADFLAQLFGLAAPKPFGPFLDVEVANEVTLAYLSAGDMEVQLQHYAFLVSDKEFDQIFGRIKAEEAEVLGRPGAEAGRPDKPPLRRPRGLLPGPERPPDGDHHQALRQRWDSL